MGLIPPSNNVKKTALTSMMALVLGSLDQACLLMIRWINPLLWSSIPPIADNWQQWRWRVVRRRSLHHKRLIFIDNDEETTTMIWWLDYDRATPHKFPSGWLTAKTSLPHTIADCPTQPNHANAMLPTLVQAYTTIAYNTILHHITSYHTRPWQTMCIVHP